MGRARLIGGLALLLVPAGIAVLVFVRNPKPAALPDGGFRYAPRPRPTPQELRALPFPENDAGQIVIAPGGPIELAIDPKMRSPVTALGECTTSILDCMGAYASMAAPGKPSHTLDECVDAMPACKTERPWLEDDVCCPTSCATEYRAARAKGVQDRDALMETYFKRDGGCFPGLSQAGR
jgi:hypothetical protein